VPGKRPPRADGIGASAQSLEREEAVVEEGVRAFVQHCAVLRFRRRAELRIDEQSAGFYRYLPGLAVVADDGKNASRKEGPIMPISSRKRTLFVLILIRRARAYPLTGPSAFGYVPPTIRKAEPPALQR